jgi:hypothetical protein
MCPDKEFARHHILRLMHLQGLMHLRAARLPRHRFSVPKFFEIISRGYGLSEPDECDVLQNSGIGCFLLGMFYPILKAENSPFVSRLLEQLTACSQEVWSLGSMRANVRRFG